MVMDSIGWHGLRWSEGLEEELLQMMVERMVVVVVEARPSKTQEGSMQIQEKTMEKGGRKVSKEEAIAFF